jgi:hypothetical protein
VHEVDLLAITARRAQILTLVASHKTQLEIARQLYISPCGVRSHIDWLRTLTRRRSMRALGEWWQAHRKQWLMIMAGVAGLPVETMSTTSEQKGDHIMMGPMGGLII